MKKELALCEKCGRRVVTKGSLCGVCHGEQVKANVGDFPDGNPFCPDNRGRGAWWREKIQAA